MRTTQVKTLADCKLYERCEVTNVAESDLAQRLMELGFVPGARIHIELQAPFGNDPLAVRVRGTLVALRRAEAGLIEVTE